MKPTPVTRLFAKRDLDPPADPPRRPAVSPLFVRATEAAGSGSREAAPKPSPIFTRDQAKPERRTDAPLRPVFVRAQDAQPPAAMPSASPAAAPRQHDLSIQLEQAYERGRQDGRAAERLEQEQSAAAALVAQRERAILERVEFQLNEYAKFSSTISAAFEELEQRISASVARILAMVVEEGVANAALAELKATLAHLIADRTSGLIRIRGPERLIGRLRDSLDDYAINFEYILEDKLDVTVEADDTLIETQLERWTAMLTSNISE